MQATIELSESMYRQSERAARRRGLSVEQLIARGLERELAEEPEGAVERSPALEHGSTFVTLPLILSKQPGTLDLSNFDFDDLLA